MTNPRSILILILSTALLIMLGYWWLLPVAIPLLAYELWDLNRPAGGDR